MSTIPLAKPFFDDDELIEIRAVLNSGWVSQGPKVKEFEGVVSSYTGTAHAIAVNNCTAALHLVNLCSGITKGDEVLVADFTFPATGHAVMYCGAKPVFVDIEEDTYNLDPSILEEKITDRTRAVIPVHTFGQMADMNGIRKIAEEYDLLVIEDAACALGARQNGKPAGSLGDAACFSFHARKGVTTGEGGMVVTGDAALAERVRYFSVFGMKAAWEREHSEEVAIPEFCDVGYNYKMSDILAAVGVAQMRKAGEIIQRKRELARYYDKKLQSMDLIQSPAVARGNEHVYQSYVTLLHPSVSRNKIIRIMGESGIQTQIGTYASHIQPVYRSDDICPVSLQVSRSTLALPLYYTMTEKEIDIVVSTLKEHLERK